MSWFSLHPFGWLLQREESGVCWAQAVPGVQHLPCLHVCWGCTSLGRLGLALGLWQRRAGVSQTLLGLPSKTGSLLQPENLLPCLLNDLYLSDLLNIKFKICIQRC